MIGSPVYFFRFSCIEDIAPFKLGDGDTFGILSHGFLGCVNDLLYVSFMLIMDSSCSCPV